LEDVDLFARWSKAVLLGVVGSVVGVFLAAFVALGAEALDDRLKSSEDIKRITHLPVLATLGNLEQMSEEERENWAFRAWTLIAGRLSKSANHGLVCGFISAHAGEGRSTWVSLLAEAASQRGLRVLTVSADGANDGPSMSRESPVTAPNQAPGEVSKDSAVPIVGAAPDSPTQPAADILPSTSELTRRLTEAEALPVISVPLPDRVWDLDRRKQWHSALAHWRAIEGLVILVELPPASMPESVLLAESVPQLIWLVDSGRSRARETRMHLETLRHARCRLAGAVLNREPDPIFKS
jgi:Mrp family chromosome partitioning ATPase